MPRRSSDGRSPDWNILYELAAPQAGYFTLTEGREAGYSPELLQYYVHEGRVERAGRGLFRLTHFPPSDHEDLVVDWLWSGKAGVFSHETALALENLSDALPTERHMTVPSAWRRRRLRTPNGLVLHYSDIGRSDTTWKGPVPLTAPLRTVLDCMRAHVEPALVQQAISQALKRGYFSKADLQATLDALEAGELGVSER
jgi:predicted transcriptional regulator of viral defense system